MLLKISNFASRETERFENISAIDLFPIPYEYQIMNR
jgi:hypothetical protein